MTIKKAITATVLFEAESLNHNEGFANNVELKKMTRGNGATHTYVSRQTLRYDIVRMGNELFDWNLDTVDDSTNVVQFKKDLTIEDSVEMDLFGYMRTKTKKATDGATTKRLSPVRINTAHSLEPFVYDTDFQTNAGLAQRIDAKNAIVNAEMHKSLYSYTFTINLEAIGRDKNDGTVLSDEEKFNRLKELLTIIQFLNRNIRGRQENLNPVFIIGGIYPIANPFFEGRMRIYNASNAFGLDLELLKSIDSSTFMSTAISDYTKVGSLSNYFENEADMKAYFGNRFSTVDTFFANLIQEVAAYYEVEYEATSN